MRGQSTQEFLLILPLVFTVFAAFVILFFYQTTLLTQTRERLHARNAAQELASAANAVYLAGDGATYNFSRGASFPDYNATLRSGIVEITSPHSNIVQFPLLIISTNEAQLNASINISYRGGSIVME